MEHKNTHYTSYTCSVVTPRPNFCSFDNNGRCRL